MRETERRGGATRAQGIESPSRSWNYSRMFRWELDPLGKETDVAWDAAQGKEGKL